MAEHAILLSVPGLRERDVAAMPHLRELMAGGQFADLVPSFPCVTCPVQAAMTTGQRPNVHGVVANGFYWRERRQVEMWTSPNECIDRPQIWDLLSHREGGPTTAVWFPLHSKGCEADYACTPAPIHNPDGSESLWCYTRPIELYGTLRDRLGHFPLMNFWGPMANVKSSAWILDSAVLAANSGGPTSSTSTCRTWTTTPSVTGPTALRPRRPWPTWTACWAASWASCSRPTSDPPLVLVAGEYAITPVGHVTYPNRVLREAGLLAVREEDGGEQLDLAASRAWALVDHQFSHVFVADGNAATAAQVADLFRNRPGIAEVLVGDQRARYHMDHPHSGEVILISTPESWQAYYWWLSDDRAPGYAHTVDIHRKPGYDPVELHFDFAAKQVPLDATLVKGSHGAPAVDPSQRSVILSSVPGVLPGETMTDLEVFDVVMRQFGVAMR